MDEILSATVDSRNGIVLDPRTKLFMLITITTLMFSTSNDGIMNIVKPILSLIPFALILSEHKFKTAGKYAVLYAVCFVLERLALNVWSGMISFLILAATSIMTRFAPGIMTGAYLISSTSVSEFISAMERMHVTEKIIIPLSVIFRFFPTIKEEYQAKQWNQQLFADKDREHGKDTAECKASSISHKYLRWESVIPQEADKSSYEGGCVDYKLLRPGDIHYVQVAGIYHVASEISHNQQGNSYNSRSSGA